jgi:hypothetical protein
VLGTMGKPTRSFACWIVLRHPESNTGIEYCEFGYGPSFL